MSKERHRITNEEWESCKDYFNNECAYCGESLKNYYNKKQKDFIKEHFINDGSGRLDNCVPACNSCNNSKRNKDFDKWYKNKDYYSLDRDIKIHKWLNEDYKKHIHAETIGEIITYNTDKGHLLNIKNNDIKLTEYLSKKLKENGRKSVWVAEKLDIPYKTYISKIDCNTIDIKELLIICNILKLPLTELHNIFPDQKKRYYCKKQHISN